MASPSSKNHLHHVVIFPFMAQGHTLPLLDLSKAFSRRGLSVTVITTPSNALTISRYIQSYPNIHLKQMPFPQTQGLPNDCENSSQLPSMSLLVPFLRATLELQKPFEDILKDMSESGSPPVCVISDFFLGWTVPSCQKFSIPRFAFHGMGVVSMVICKNVAVNGADLMTGLGSDTEPITIPGVKLPFVLTLPDLSDVYCVNDFNDPFFQFICEVGKWDEESAGVIINSFMELEGEHISSLESFYKNECKAWCVGPMLLYDDDTEGGTAHQSDPHIKWLDDRNEHKSVIYVSFGTQADVSDMQLDEVAYGLVLSGHPFIWAVRSKTWAPPQGIEERLMSRGLIVKEWVDQRRVLAHRAIGGFLSHCGWNSALESLCMGVPVLAWPMIAEQVLNAKFLVEGLGMGLRIPLKGGETVADGRGVICDLVRELMESEKGKKAGEKAQELGKLARQAMKKEGSSQKSLIELIEYLCEGRAMEL